ncbi:MAG: nitrogenase component 1 [bacterium]
MAAPRKPPKSHSRRASNRRTRPGNTRVPGVVDSEGSRYGARDEEFWLRQDTRLAGQLGQPCCTLSGMCTLLGTMDGNFSVIIHGERDCGGCFVSHRMPGNQRFYCTGISEAQATSGRVDEPLEQCLRLVLAEGPDVVLVLTTCVINMIGSQPEPVVERVALDTDIPVLLLRTSGLRLSTQAEMVDWLFESLAGLPQLPEGDNRWRQRLRTMLHETSHALYADNDLTREDVEARFSRALADGPRAPERVCNLIGLPPDGVRTSELLDALTAAGIAVAGLYPFDTDLDAWRRISHAAVNVVADRRLYPRLLGRLEGEHGMPTVEVPLPIGLGQSVRFYRRVGEFFGVHDELQRILAPRIEAVTAKVDEFRDRARSTRLAMGIRMLNNYRVDQLAYEGLGDVDALAELGFDVTLLVQGAPEERPRFEEMLEALGCRLPFHVFPSPWELAPLLAQGDYQVAYLADHSWEEAQKAGVPMIKSRELAPLLAGVEPNLAVLSALLQAAEAGRGEVHR